MTTLTEGEFQRRFMSGAELWGDDFTASEIDEWFEDERQAYVSLEAGYQRPENAGTVSAQYEALNRYHGFDRIDAARSQQVLALGAFDGAELQPILRAGMQVTILDPALVAPVIERDDVVVDLREPQPSGELDFDANSIDLVTCFGVLHHIPNVSFLIGELGRVLSPGGAIIIREPISSMGDWRQPRPGMTPRERGIPLAVFRRAFQSAGLEVEREALCMFAGTAFAGRKLGVWPYANRRMVRLDAALSRMTRWNYRYSPRTKWQRMRPGAVAYVVRKPLPRS